MVFLEGMTRSDLSCLKPQRATQSWIKLWDPDMEGEERILSLTMRDPGPDQDQGRDTDPGPDQRIRTDPVTPVVQGDPHTELILRGTRRKALIRRVHPRSLILTNLNQVLFLHLSNVWNNSGFFMHC